MSIRPTTIDRRGDNPCIPEFYTVAKRMSEGRAPSLRERVTRAISNLCRRIAK